MYNEQTPQSTIAALEEKMETHETAATEAVINIVVEVAGKNKHVKFNSSPVTGRAIREEAGVPLTDDLTRLVHGKPSGGNIGLDQRVEIKDGDHFIALPSGTVS